MKLLFFGDIFGKGGRDALLKKLPELKSRYQPDFIIANAENAASGKGLTPKIAEELWSAGIHVLTMGNHTLDRKEIEPTFADPRLLRPANYAPGWPGKGWGIYATAAGEKIAVIQTMGRVYMPLTDCPFRTTDEILKNVQSQTKIIFVDFHAEITSEKAAMGWHLDGRVSAVVGTHTHVQTADERILPQGTAFLTDAGSCGPYNSIIGADVKPALERFLTGKHTALVVAEGDAAVCGCLIEIDSATGRATRIERIREIVSTAQ